MGVGQPLDGGRVAAAPTFHPAPASDRTAPFGTPGRPLPLIIDSDPGLDDALAIGLACASPELRLLAVTTVGGNTDVAHCTENALRLLHAYGRDDVPVAEGAAGALLGDVVRAAYVHGASGVGNTHLPPSPTQPRPEGAIALMARLLAESREPVVIAPIGPLTNIALLLREYPRLASQIAHVCLMGGSIGEGNMSAAAEFNIVADPEAADVVFRAGLPITMMGLDVTHQAQLDRGSAQALRDLGTTSGAIAAELTEYALARNLEWTGRETSAVHDAVAIAHLVAPDLVAVARYHVAVETGHGPARGRTVCDGQPGRWRRRGLEPNAEVGIAIDPVRLERLILDAYAKLP